MYICICMYFYDISTENLNFPLLYVCFKEGHKSRFRKINPILFTIPYSKMGIWGILLLKTQRTCKKKTTFFLNEKKIMIVCLYNLKNGRKRYLLKLKLNWYNKKCGNFENLHKKSFMALL